MQLIQHNKGASLWAEQPTGKKPIRLRIIRAARYVEGFLREQSRTIAEAGIVDLARALARKAAREDHTNLTRS